MVERAPAHVGEWRELDGAALEELSGLLEAHQVVERVVERTQVRVDLLREIARQEAETLAGFDCRAHQYDALHLVALERIDRARHGEVGLAGARRADADGQVMREDALDVLDLVRRAPVQIRAARHQLRTLGAPRLVSLLELGVAE